MSGVKRLLQTQDPLACGAMAKYPATDALRKTFATISRFGDPITLYDERGDHIYLPRAVCPVGPNDQRVRGYSTSWSMQTQPKNAEQARMLKEMVALVEEDQSFILQAGTGSGKTWLALATLCEIGRTGLIIVPKDDLMKQWRARILEHTTLTDKQVGRIQQDVCDVYGKPLVLASAKSVAIPGRYPPEVLQLFGAMVLDECHRMAADTLQVLCKMFPGLWRIGLSATPNRKDGKEVVLLSNVGPVRVKGEGVPMQPKVLRYVTEWVCPRQKYTDAKTGETKIRRIPHKPGEVGHILKYLFRDQERNRLITHLVKRCYANSRKLVVFSDFVDHLQLLQLLALKAGVPQSALGRFYGHMTEKQIDENSVKPMLFAAYGKMSEGTDFPWFDACLLAGPRSDVEQSCGRVLREYPDKLQPVVFDLVDEDSPVFASYVNGRDSYYARVKAEVKTMKVAKDAASAAAG